MKKAIVGAVIVGLFAFVGTAAASGVIAPWFTVNPVSAAVSKTYSLERVADSDGTVCYVVVNASGSASAVSCVR